MRASICAALIICVVVISSRADSVVMQNGDRYNGKVLSVNASNVVFHSDVLGAVTLSRTKVAQVAIGVSSATNQAPVVSSSPATNQTVLPGKTKEADELSATLRQLGAYTNLIQTVQSQFLAAAGPEANAKFSQMLNDLTSGKMNIADLRAQARDVASQLRTLQSEAGEEGGLTADLYLSILDRFLQDTSPPKDAVTNAPGGSLQR